jgi:hypothetical protein
MGTRVAAGGGAILPFVALSNSASAHCIVGNRFFPATVGVDDPCVADELSLPTIAGFKNGDDPAANELDIAGEYSKTITPNFGISVEEAWIHLDPPGEKSVSGFDNLGTSFKYQFVRDASRELAMSVSLDADWGGTGSRAIDAEPFTTLTPTLFLGKGLGFHAGAAAKAIRCHGSGRLCDPDQEFDQCPGRRDGADRGDAESALDRLGRHAAIQHALPQIERARFRPAGIHQPPDPAG